jgi:DNA helicase HerA-like ATPase
VYFVTQNPLDVPDAVLGQLGNRVQHALRAFTPRDQKAVRAAAETMRPNPKFAVVDAITELGVGEALVSLLDEQGRPSVTERLLVVPPGSKIGPIDDAERARLMAASSLAGVYENAIDRESAYEMLKTRVAEKQPGASAPPQRAPGSARQPQPPAERSIATEILFGRVGPRGGRQSDGLVEVMAKSAARAMGSQTGRALLRGLLGSLLGGRR